MNMRFNTCLILVKSIEPVVKNATDVWSDVYKLHKPTKEIVEIKDDDNISDEEEMDGDNTISMDEEKEEEEKDDEEQVEEADDPVNIAAAVIASLPHSPPKSTSQLQVSTMQVPSTSSTELMVTSSSTES